MTSLNCPHDDTIVKEKRNPKSGTYYQCLKCGCTFRAVLALVTNNTECYNQRYNIVPNQIKKRTKK